MILRAGWWICCSLLSFYFSLIAFCCCCYIFTACSVAESCPALGDQAPLSMEFSRQEYWSGLPFPTPGDLPDPGIKYASLVSPALAGGFFTIAPPGKPYLPPNLDTVVGSAWKSSLTKTQALWPEDLEMKLQGTGKYHGVFQREGSLKGREREKPHKSVYETLCLPLNWTCGNLPLNTISKALKLTMMQTRPKRTTRKWKHQAIQIALQSLTAALTTI